MAKIPRWLLVLALGCALLLPMLGSYGLWDPHEIKQADVAQEMVRTGDYTDVTQGKRYPRRPILTVWLVALGFKLLGVNELAGRFPLAICGVLSLLVAYRVARRLAGERAGLIGAFVLATTPTFIFQSRQLVSEVVFYAAILASAGGLIAYLWPVDGRRSRLDLALAGVGLVAGFLSQGLVLGFVFPVAGLALAIALSWRTPNRADEGGIWPAAEGPDLGPEASVGQALRVALIPMIVALAAAGAVIGLLFAVLKDPSFMVLGGEVRKVAVPPTFETTLKDLGWSFFPWFAVVPMLLAHALLAQHRTTTRRDRMAFPLALVAVLVVGGYVLAAVWVGHLGEIRYPALPWLALGVGLLIHQVLRQGQPVHRLWGVIAAGVVLVIQQDFFMAPESLTFSHIIGHAKYPVDLSLKAPVRAFGLVFAALFFASLGGVPRPIKVWDRTERRRGVRAAIGGGIRNLARWLAGVLDTVGQGIRFLAGPNARWLTVATGGVAVVFAGWCGFWLTPKLSLHMSNKALFEVYHRCRERGAAGKEKLAQYQVPGRGAAYYNNGQIEEVGSQSQLFELLRRPERWFVLIPANHLASIDQSARRSKLPYFVLDDRSSQYLLISNKLQGKCNADHNPLRRFVLSSPPSPKKVLSVNFENRVKLMGYDVDDVVTRGGKFRITLYFHVLGQMPSGYKVFLHFDQPASRFHGDHEPLDGKYPTQYWLPGDYVVDPHDVEIPLITTPSGTYTIYMGFWLGSQRLKVTEGPNDGVNRVRLGTIRVR